MNIEIFIVFLFLSFLMLLNKSKEGMRNPLIPPEYEFSVLTAPQEVMSGYYQEELCRNDPEWKSGDMKCHHILNKGDCSLKSDNGVLANDACLVSCDTCPSSVTIKQRINTGENLEERGIVFEDSNEYNYFEIYDKIDRANSDIDVISDTFDYIKKYNDNYLDVAAVCKECFYNNSSNVKDIIDSTRDGSYLSRCPEECRKFANCNLSTNEDECDDDETISQSPQSNPDN